MKTVQLLSALTTWTCSIVFFSCGATGDETPKDDGRRHRPPHVVVLVIDDAGLQDVGFSSKLQFQVLKHHPNVPNFTYSPIRTPFLDSIADESVVFPNYYTHPTCTPSRSALMTGKYAFMVGMPFPIVGPGSMVGLDPSLKTIANHFQDAGYRTHMVGKWHLGHAKDVYRPPRRGFDTFMGCIGAGFDHYTKSVPGCLDLWNTTSSALRQFTPDEIDVTQHATELFSDEAVRLIRKHDAAKPFFLYLSYTSPHAPLQADEAFINSRECRDVPNKSRRLFCAMMLQLDGGVKRVVDAMKQKEMWNDTYFVFTTDNGGMPIVGGFNYPFRGAKAEAWDGAVRGPAFFRFPTREKHTAGVYHGLVHIADWLPTLVSAAGLRVNMGDIDGVDHFSALQNNQLLVSIGEEPPASSQFPRKSVIAQADMFLNVSAVRDGCHKLILGAPGFNHVYEEPDHRLFRDVSFLHSGLERFFPLIEWATPAVLTQFLKYGLRMMVERIYAFFQGTRYFFDQISFVKFHSLSTVTASYQDEPITLQWNARPGPVVFLYNVCDDPTESVNLALKEKEDVDRLYQILLNETARAPVQFAGDVALRNAQQGWRCSPFLSDDEVILSEDDGTSLDPSFVAAYGTPRRLFVVAFGQMMLALVVSLVVLLATLYLVTKQLNDS